MTVSPHFETPIEGTKPVWYEPGMPVPSSQFSNLSPRLIPPRIGKCLIVDDRIENIDALSALLREENVNVKSATSGDEALELLLTEDFALALLDVQMPGMTGFELAELMREAPRTRHIPIIFITAGAADRDHVFRGYESGAVDYLVKPLEPRVLRSKVHFFLDVHAQAQQLRRTEQMFRSTFENAAVGIADAELDGRWIKMNRAFREMLGYAATERVSPTLFELVSSETLMAETARLLAGEIAVISREEKIRRRDGSLMWTILNVSLNRHSSGPSLVISVQDISAQKRAKDEADAANRLKSEFLAIMSHEIRTPMTAILGYSEILKSEEMNENERQDFVERIHTNGEHLLHLIDDILDLSKFEAGGVVTERIEVDIHALAAETLRLLGSVARKKALTLELHSQKGAGTICHSDPHRIRQVLNNLLGNALKFTREGRVTISIAHEDDGRSIVIFVEDTGIGMSDAQVSGLFQPFAQADSSMTRKFGGTGLGLALSKRIARTLGGDLTLDWTELDRGSRFKFSIQV